MNKDVDQKTQVQSDRVKKNIGLLLDKVFQLLSSILGVLLTFCVWNYGQINNVTVCLALALIATVILPKHEDVFFSGTLAGIATIDMFKSLGFVVLTGFFIFVIFNIIKGYVVNYGGRAGVISITANIITCAVIWLLHYTNIYTYDYPLTVKDYYYIFDVWIYVFGPLFSAFSTLGSYLVFEHCISVKKKISASTLTGLFICLLLLMFKTTLFTSKQSSYSYGEILIVHVHYGILAGTAKDALFENCQLILPGRLSQHYFIVGYIAGWIGISLCWILNIAGKNGLVAFLGCLLYIHSFRAYNYIRDRLKGEENGEIHNVESKQIEIEVRDK